MPKLNFSVIVSTMANLESSILEGPEAEDDQMYELIDTVIFPKLLYKLNQAKIDYHAAYSSASPLNYRIMLARRYLDILKNGSLLEFEPLLTAENYRKRPKLALVMDHAAHLTISWINLINGLQLGNGEIEFMQWSHARSREEVQKLGKLRAACAEERA